MEVCSNSTKAPLCHFDEVPNEVLEFILSFLPPYKDLENCMCVNKRWNVCAKNVIRKSEIDLYRAVSETNITWKNIKTPNEGPSISKRFYHAACIYDHSMYVFGGCTTHFTMFNDLWRFDLSTRQWFRPLAMGTYPTPKAYATMVPYKDNLILFGGLTHSTSSSIFNYWTMFSEVNLYNVTSNRWILKSTRNSPPPMGGHTAVIKGDMMIVCGGVHTSNNYVSSRKCEIFLLDLNTMEWSKQPTCGVKEPASRHGHSVVMLDDDHMMLIGGKKMKVYNDYWLLRMTGAVWTWTELTVNNKEWSTNHIWCNPVCKVGDKVIALCLEESSSICPLMKATRVPVAEGLQVNSSTHRLQQNMKKPVDRDNNVNGRRGMLPHHRQNNNNNNIVRQIDVSNIAIAGPSSAQKNINILANNPQQLHVNRKNANINNRGSLGDVNKNVKGMLGFVRRIRDSNVIRMAAFNTKPTTANIALSHFYPHQDNLEKQQIRQKLINQPQVNVVESPVEKVHHNGLLLHVMDISTVLQDHAVTWMKPQAKVANGAPEEIIMYTLLPARGEIILFGGLFHNADLSTIYMPESPHNFSNGLYLIVPPKETI